MTCAFALIRIPFSIDKFDRPEAQQALQILAPGITTGIFLFWQTLATTVILVAGIALLKGLNWGRLLYLWFIPLFFIVFTGFYGVPQGPYFIYYLKPVLIGLISYIVIFILLTRPKVLGYFHNFPTLFRKTGSG